MLISITLANRYNGSFFCQVRESTCTKTAIDDVCKRLYKKIASSFNQLRWYLIFSHGLAYVMRLCAYAFYQFQYVRYGHFRKRKIFRLLRVFLSLIFNTLGRYLCSSKIILIDAEKVTLSFRMVSYRQYFAQHFCRHCSKILQLSFHYYYAFSLFKRYFVACHDSFIC